MASFKIHKDVISKKNSRIRNKIQSNSKKKNFKENNEDSNKENKKFDSELQNKEITKKRKQVKINKNEVEKIEKECNTIIRKIAGFNKNKNDHSCLFDKCKENQLFYFPQDEFSTITTEYQHSIYEFYRQQERRYILSKMYMKTQTEINFKMRSILIDWLTSVAEEYNLQPKTLFLSIKYVDHIIDINIISKNFFQLLGLSALRIATKYEEIYPPKAGIWINLAADIYSSQELLQMEKFILKRLNFIVDFPTAYTFITYISFVCKLREEILFLALYISEIAIFEGINYIQILPSELACGSIALARHTLKEDEFWTDFLELRTGYKLKQLIPVIVNLHSTYKYYPTASIKYKAIFNKYSRNKYGKVAHLKPKEFIMTDLVDQVYLF